MADTIKFDSAYQGYDPQTIYKVDTASKTLNPFTSGDAYAKAGYSFGQESLADPNAYGGYKIGSPITLESLQATQALTVPTATPQADNLAPVTAEAQQTSKSLADYIKEVTPPESQTSKDYNALLGDINTLLPGLGNRGAEQLAAEQQANLPELKQRLAGLNAQILAKVAEANKSNASYEALIASLEDPRNQQQQGIPMAAIIGQQAQVRKAQLAEANNKSADLLLLQAVASGLQGNVNAMQSSIDRAIDLKYQDKLDTIYIKQQQLSYLKNILDQEEDRFALASTRKREDDIKALERKYNEERERIAEQKAQAKEKINLAFTANVQTPLMNVNGEWTRISDGKTYATPEELWKDFPQLKNSFDNAYKMGLVTDVSSQRLADIEYIQQLRAKYNDAGITMGDTATSAEQKVQKNSRIYREETRAPQYASGGGSGTLAGTYIIDAATDARVQEIMRDNPGEYGNAADQIDAEFGKGAATHYDDWLRRVYVYGQNINEVVSNKPPTNAETLAAGYANRTLSANEVINSLENSIKSYSRAGFESQMTDTAARFNTRSVLIQQYDQAARNFINAVLRRESGAVISNEEFKNAYLQYLPRPGDSAEVLKQKARNREDTIQGLTISAGSAFTPPSRQESNNMVTANDGSVWRANADGTYTRIK